MICLLGLVRSGAMVFFAVDWPPLARLTLLACLAAFIAVRLAIALISLAAISPGQRLRLSILAGLICIAIANAAIAEPLGISHDVSDAIAFCFSAMILVVATETVWSTMHMSSTLKAGLTAFGVVLWIAWSLDMRGLFWLGIYAIVLPSVLKGVTRVAGHLHSDATGLRGVLITHGIRAVVIGMAVGWLAIVWHFNPDAPGRRDPWISALVYGGMKSVGVLVLADLVWQLARNWFDRTLLVATDTTSLSPADAAPRAIPDSAANL
ncbi:hypothetical protein EV291_14911 [Rhizobium sp. BK068]|nr:hypothetical protein EV291_14911 [Rhizobium sp. BK068]